MANICLRIKSGQFLFLVYCLCNKNKDFKLISKLLMHVLCLVTCRLHWWHYQVTQKPSQACCGWITTRCAVQAGITLFASGTFRLGSTNKLWCVYRLYRPSFPLLDGLKCTSVTWRRVSNVPWRQRLDVRRPIFHSSLPPPLWSPRRPPPRNLRARSPWGMGGGELVGRLATSVPLKPRWLQVTGGGRPRWS